MVTLKFTTEKAAKQIAIIPAVVVDYSGKSSLELVFGWLNRMLNVYISWTRKSKNGTANDTQIKAKCH